MIQTYHTDDNSSRILRDGDDDDDDDDNRYSLFLCEGQLCKCSWVPSLLGRYFYNIFIVKIIETVFSFTIKDNNIFPCLHNIRLSYNI